MHPRTTCPTSHDSNNHSCYPIAEQRFEDGNLRRISSTHQGRYMLGPIPLCLIDCSLGHPPRLMWIPNIGQSAIQMDRFDALSLGSRPYTDEGLPPGQPSRRNRAFEAFLDFVGQKIVLATCEDSISRFEEHLPKLPEESALRICILVSMKTRDGVILEMPVNAACWSMVLDTLRSDRLVPSESRLWIYWRPLPQDWALSYLVPELGDARCSDAKAEAFYEATSHTWTPTPASRPARTAGPATVDDCALVSGLVLSLAYAVGSPEEQYRRRNPRPSSSRGELHLWHSAQHHDYRYFGTRSRPTDVSWRNRDPEWRRQTKCIRD